MTTFYKIAETAGEFLKESHAKGINLFVGQQTICEPCNALKLMLFQVGFDEVHYFFYYRNEDGSVTVDIQLFVGEDGPRVEYENVPIEKIHLFQAVILMHMLADDFIADEAAVAA